jgi:hypothetical protein
MQKAVTMHHHRHAAAMMESEQTYISIYVDSQESNRTPHY